MKKSKEQISFNMKQVKNKDSEIELLLRKELWRRGIRYRKNVTHLMGKPDIAFIGKGVVVFCDSEFWHGYNWDKKKEEIKTNRDFWYKKIEGNIERDKKVNEYYKEQGWIVIRFWGSEIKSNVSECVDRIIHVLSIR